MKKAPNKNKTTKGSQPDSILKKFITKKHLVLPIVSAVIVGSIGTYLWQSTQAATNTHYPYMFPQSGATPGSCSKSTLKQGSSGPCVVVLQNQLNIWRYKINGAVGSDYIKGDGVFGSQTKSRVMAFQQYMKIKPDGIVGPSQTWPKLMMVSSSSINQWALGNNGTAVTNNSAVGGITCSRAWVSGTSALSSSTSGGKTATVTGAFKNTATSRVWSNVELRILAGSTTTKSSTVQRWSLAGAESKSVAFTTKSLAKGLYLAQFYSDGKKLQGCSASLRIN